MRPRSRSLRSIFLIGASICMGNSLLIDLAQSPSPSPAAFRPAGVYNDNFRTLMPDRETACWTSDGTLLRPELCNNESALDPCRMTRMNPVIQDILILELMLSSGEGVFIERGKSRVASRLTDFSESEEDLSSDHPEHEGAALDVRSAAKERRKGP
ncbi:hypothetical protein L1987_88872 [Smallanthus sonchifolius]|nr:hypothetical protein L1987_88872 [Smallanthus sonchifolius]